MARASITLLLEQPYGRMDVLNPTGHSAIYLDHVCAETPLRLRPCHPGELGAVISRYDHIAGYDWVAIPLLPYLYAVDRPEDIPGSVDAETVAQLRGVYRRAHLETIAPDDEDGQAPAGNWYQLIGSAFDRTVYGFQVNSTAEQDSRVMALLNDRRNVERYNGAFRNCADFARVMLNRYFPHAIRRNFVADLGLTTPKSVARSLTRFAGKHPEAGLQIFAIPQVRGSLPRSHRPQDVTESLLTRYAVPLTLMSPVLTGVVFAAWLGHGRFDMPRNAPVLDLGAMRGAEVAAEAHKTPGLVGETGEAETAALAGAAALPGSSSTGLEQPGVERTATFPSAPAAEKRDRTGPLFPAPVSSLTASPSFSVPGLNLPLFP